MRFGSPAQFALALAVLLALPGCVTTTGSGGGRASSGIPPGAIPLRPTGKVYHGKMSWYSVRTNRGTRTASGEPFRNDRRTAAHRTLPFGSLVMVTNLRNGRSQVVRITDRGPFIRGRIIDVAIGVARELDFVNTGVVPVRMELMEPLERRKPVGM